MAEVTSTHSHLSGRLKVNSLTLNVAGASAATAPNADAIRIDAQRSDLIECIVLLLVERPTNVKRATWVKGPTLKCKASRQSALFDLGKFPTASSSYRVSVASQNCASLR